MFMKTGVKKTMNLSNFYQELDYIIRTNCPPESWMLLFCDLNFPSNDTSLISTLLSEVVHKAEKNNQQIWTIVTDPKRIELYKKVGFSQQNNYWFGICNSPHN